MLSVKVKLIKNERTRCVKIEEKKCGEVLIKEWKYH